MMKLHTIGESIETYDQLVAALRTGVQLELGVMPPYFTAMYSIVNQASPACRILRAVLMEEMLHLALNCNLLNAIGSSPLFEPPYLPSYPLPLPHYHTGFNVSLEKLTPEVAKSVFMMIERPSWTVHHSHKDAPAQVRDWETLGQFYKGIIEGFKTVSKHMPNLFVNDTRLQYGPNTIYSNGGGILLPVCNLEQAIAAITQNMDQTQGYKDIKFQPFGSDGAMELSHYRRFEQLATGVIPVGDVYPMIKDIKAENLPEPVRSLSILFNDCWGIFIRALGETFNNPLNYSVYFTQTMWMMKQVFPELAVLLMSTPAFAENPQLGNAGPSFDYSAKPIEQIKIEAKQLKNCQINPEWQTVLDNTIKVLDYMIVERGKLTPRQ